MLKRRFGAGLDAASRSLYGGAYDSREGANPMEGLANLADVMLVFACGLMLALTINWNLDLAPASSDEALRAEELTELERLAGGEDSPEDGETRYEELGVVYRDPATGKLYMVEKDAGGGADRQ